MSVFWLDTTRDERTAAAGNSTVVAKLRRDHRVHTPPSLTPPPPADDWRRQAYATPLDLTPERRNDCGADDGEGTGIDHRGCIEIGPIQKRQLPSRLASYSANIDCSKKRAAQGRRLPRGPQARAPRERAA